MKSGRMMTNSSFFDLLHEEHILVVHGSGFSPSLGKGHFRIVYLPDVDVLNDAFDRIEAFLIRHR